MLGILRKDYGIFALATLAIFPVALLIEGVNATELRLALVTMNIVLAWLLVFVPLNITEMEEAHSNGYALMASLPVRVWEIVAAKFLLFLAAMATCTAVQFAFLAMVQPAPSLLALAHTAVLLTGAAGLLFGGMGYAVIFSFGYARLLTVAQFVVAPSSVAVMLLLTMPAARELLRKAAGLLLELSGVEVVLGGLALYVLLFFVSVALFHFAPKKRYRPLD